MHAERLVFREKFQCEVEGFEAVVKDSREVLVENRCSLVSAGTELAMFARIHPHFERPDKTWVKYPFRPGYSSIGKVKECGADVKELAVGDVIYFWGNHGTHQVLHLDLDRFIKLPADVPPEPFLFYHLAEIALTAPWRSPVLFGQTVLVAGLGLVGNLAAQLYQLAGAGKVYGFDLMEKRLEQSRLAGIRNAINPGKKSFLEALSDIGVSGVDIAVEAIGSGPVIRECLQSVHKNGSVVLLGSPRVPMELNLYEDVHCRGISLVGAHEGTLSPEEKRRAQPFLVTLLQSGLLKTAPLITHRVKLEDGLKAYEGLLHQKDEFLGVSFFHSNF